MTTMGIKILRQTISSTSTEPLPPPPQNME
nr:MAG TPA: hypothetical protein [Caudoviricetes sp.]